MYLRPVEGAILEISSYQINFQLLNLFTLFKKQKTFKLSLLDPVPSVVN